MESQSETTQTVSALKLPVLKIGEYDLWSMRMEQYLTFTDHALWEVIVNGDSVSPVASASAGAEAIPDEQLLKFHACKDAKSLWEAIKNSEEGLDKTYDRFQKLISQLEIHGEVISQEDANLKLLRSLPLAWNNISLIMRNKSDLDTLSIDDLYNNLKVYESDIKGQTSSSLNSQNVAFGSSDISSSTNETVNTAHSVSAASSKDQTSTASYGDDVMAPRNKENRNRDAPRRNAPVDTSTINALVVQDGIGGYEWSFQGEECLTNFALMAYTSQGSSSSSSSSSSNSKNEAVYEENIEFLKYDVQVKDISIKDLKNQLDEALKEKDDLKLKLENFEESSQNLTKLINSQISAKDKTGLGYDGQMNEGKVVHRVFNSRESDVDDNPVIDRFKTGEGFHAVPPPYTRNYMPLRPDLSFDGLDESVFNSIERKITTSMPETKTSISRTSKDIVEKSKTVRPSALIIKEWDTDNDNNVKSVNKENTHRQVEYPRKSQSLRGNRRNWNGMMTQKLGNGFEFIKKSCFVCRSFNHLIKDCDFHDNKMIEKPVLNNKGRVTGQREIRPVWNNAQRVNHQNKLTHSHPKRNFVPTAVVTKLGQVLVNAAKQSSPRAATSISTARPVNTAAPKPKVNDALPTTYSYFKAHSLGNPQYTLQDQGIFDSGCSRHMTGNKSFLTDYQEIDGGFVAFGGSPKGGKITGKENSVLFTETECHILSPDFKLLDESKVLLKVSRHDNMYTFDLKNVVPSGGLTCLFAKATIDEFNLWHRRLGHINFKTMNKLVKGNLVRGLPSKLFENDYTCVACQKGKQHKASYKTKLVSSISQPLQMLHMDLFGPTSNRVLVTMPHNKTPYELLHGRPPSISFMRPFRCPVTILNTLDPLGKFDGKADEGSWLHIDLLTNSMNYEPVTTGNQTNKNAGIKDNVDVVPTQQYILLPLLYDSPQSSEDAVADDAGKKTNEKPANECERNGQEKEGGASNKEGDQNLQDLRAELDKLLVQRKEGYANSTNRVSTVFHTVSAAGKVLIMQMTSNDPRCFLKNFWRILTDLQNTGIFRGCIDDEERCRG
ncbi:ribonuclease H-like domain-containing protein [Tanacetum coccineum]